MRDRAALCGHVARAARSEPRRPNSLWSEPVQGVIKSYDPATKDGIVVRDTDLVEFDLGRDALDGSLFRMLRQGQRVCFELDDAGLATQLSLGSEVDMGTPAFRGARTPRRSPDRGPWRRSPSTDNVTERAQHSRVIPVRSLRTESTSNRGKQWQSAPATNSSRTGSSTGGRSSTGLGRVVRRHRRGVRPAVPAARRQRHLRAAERGQASEQLPGAVGPQRRRPRRGPHLHRLAASGRRRPDQQLA